MPNAQKAEPVEWIYTKSIRLRNGKVIYASQYGLKAFRFPKPEKKKESVN